jgi:hypothetical protein
VGRFFDDEPDHSPKFDPFNPFRDEKAVIRNSLFGAMVCLAPFFLGFWLLVKLYKLGFMLIGRSNSGSDTETPSDDEPQIGTSLLDEDRKQ